MGFFCFGPMMHRWYSMLDQRIMARPLTQMVTKKVMADQAVFLPFFLGSFVVLNGCLRGDTNHQINRTFKNDFYEMLQTSYMVWIPAQVFNFLLLPLPYRVLFCNVVGLGWNSYIAYQSK